MTLDLTQFHAAFFEESFEALDSMEAALLELDLGAPDAERINTVFRVAHSIKGGSATFGFSEIASFTHSLETLLDELRGNRMQVTHAISDLLLKSVDVMRDMLRAVQGKRPVEAQRIADLQFDIELAIAQKPVAPVAKVAPTIGLSAMALPAAPLPTPATPTMAKPVAGAPATASASPTGVPERRTRITFRPHRSLFERGNDPLRMLRELAELGRLEVECDYSALPSFADLEPQACHLAWYLTLIGDVSETTVRDVFEWADGDCDLTIEPDVLAAAPDVTVPTPNTAHPVSADALAAVLATTSHEVLVPLPTAVPAGVVVPVLAAAPDLEAPNVAERSAPAAAGPAPPSQSEAQAASGIGESGSIRVSVEKIDELMNTVGELVITQSMLSQLGRSLEGPTSEQLRLGLTQLERNMRELQEGVMRVRMLPISFVFSRFPRMVRDLAQRLGKQIELTLSGEQTELDKTVLEKIGDPLVHLVRNSIDHGIEKPDVRRAAGKDATGSLRLHACHRGGNIAVEVSDDGGGLDKDRILAKARDRGLISATEALTEEQAWDLLFVPGFSTAEHTTDISGRGVGLDVVRRNVKELGGKIEVTSELGKGAKFVITLPLTLAIVDGQSIAVGRESYIVPLISIIESLQITQGSLNRVAGRGEVFTFRGDYVPVIRLHELFGVEPRASDLAEGLIVIVEGDGRRVGLFVDDLLGQQQVVIKSLETNYGQIDGVSGATILGDGSVALILDLPGIIRRAGARANA